MPKAPSPPTIVRAFTRETNDVVEVQVDLTRVSMEKKAAPSGVAAAAAEWSTRDFSRSESSPPAPSAVAETGLGQLGL